MKKREHYLDLIRCVAITLVIGAHTIAPYLNDPAYYGTRSWTLLMVFNTLTRAAVQLFFMISGYLMLRSSAKEDTLLFYKKRLPRLLIPLLCWNAVYTLYYARLEGRFPSLRELLDYLLNNGRAYHMWYVYTLLGIYLIAPFLRHIVRACGRRDLIILLILIMFPGAIRTMINTFLPVYVFLFDPLMEGCLGYFLLGYLLGTGQFSPKQRAGVYLLGMLGGAVEIAVNIHASSPEAIDMPFNQVYSLTHYMTAAAIFLLCRQLCTGLSPKLEAPLAAAGEVVFGVYWIHVLILESLSRLPVPFALPLSAYIALLGLLTLLASFAAAFLISAVRPLRRLLL